MFYESFTYSIDYRYTLKSLLHSGKDGRNKKISPVHAPTWSPRRIQQQTKQNI